MVELTALKEMLSLADDLLFLSLEWQSLLLAYERFSVRHLHLGFQLLLA